ncbi:hypothetical protein [Actinoplanes sp. NPDC051859]|uniref:hypothetical protein n=1 Tax=Actinoplanes sp. NPDC051859 TaxID=3363909 RepID=UPI0037AB7C13
MPPPTIVTLPPNALTVISLGMGVDSSAMLARLLIDPQVRRHRDGLVVLSAMTGEEYPRTEELMNAHLLPLMRRFEVRFVQVAALGPHVRDGYIVLSDSRQTERMIMRGPWRLSDELRANGTLPESAKHQRKCSIHAKGQPLDGWIRDHLGGAPYEHLLGFSADEPDRAVNDRSYARLGRRPRHPLIDWAWDRRTCEGYLHEQFGVVWERSCCTFCPFQNGDREGFADRWRRNPAAVVDAIILEYTALALNPRMALFGRRTARTVAASFGLHDAIAAADARLAEMPWHIYDVRRIYHPHRSEPGRKGPVWRSVRTLEVCTPQAATDVVRRMPGASVDEFGITRAWLHRTAAAYPRTEHLIVAAPTGVHDKQRTTFEQRWAWAQEGVADSSEPSQQGSK